MTDIQIKTGGMAYCRVRSGSPPAHRVLGRKTLLSVERVRSSYSKVEQSPAETIHPIIESLAVRDLPLILRSAGLKRAAQRIEYLLDLQKNSGEDREPISESSLRSAVELLVRQPIVEAADIVVDPRGMICFDLDCPGDEYVIVQVMEDGTASYSALRRSNEAGDKTYLNDEKPIAHAARVLGPMFSGNA